jgi:hypothetical protein
MRARDDFIYCLKRGNGSAFSWDAQSITDLLASPQ